MLYHASPKKYSILRPLKDEDYSGDKLNHEAVIWFSKKLDYTVFMVLFRAIEENYKGTYRFFDFKKKALFYPDSYGPLIGKVYLFEKLFSKGELISLNSSCQVYVHKISKAAGLKKTKWGDFYTPIPIKVDGVIEIKDALEYLKNQNWEIRIFLH